MKEIILSEDDLKQLEANARLMFSIAEIALIIMIPCDELKRRIDDAASPEHAFFHKGRLEAEAKIRQSIYDLAMNGSSPAQTQFLGIIENAKLDDAI